MVCGVLPDSEKPVVSFSCRCCCPLGLICCPAGKTILGSFSPAVRDSCNPDLVFSLLMLGFLQNSHLTQFIEKDFKKNVTMSWPKKAKTYKKALGANSVSWQKSS